jgi:murein DD-endopeptidase MepM/ murein hydrolase activator NlpD
MRGAVTLRIGLLPGALLVLVATAAGLAGGAGGAEAPAAGAGARAWAVRITIPGAVKGATASVVTVPPTAPPVTLPSFSYPKDGSVIVTGATRATGSTKAGRGASAAASSGITDISLFNGEITADSLAAHATAATGGSAPHGSVGGTGVANLQALGQRRSKGRVTLADWGYLTIAAAGADTSAPEGTTGYRGYVTAVDIHLTAGHGGLPAGSEIQLGYAEADVHTAPAAVLGALAGALAGPLPGDRPQLLPPTTGPLVGVPQIVTPPLDGGPYTFPVFGPSSYSDTFGVSGPGTGYHHGDDIFGDLGQPLVAVANGTIFSAGWNRVGGNRIWLRDRAGDEFYYAHLSAFSRLVKKGAHVRAGQVIGFMGATGDVEGKPTHLHFEIHPVSMLFLGLGGAVNPTAYLRSWRRLEKLAFPVATGWAPKVPGTIQAPQPGAILLGVSDISSADGLAPSTLRRLAPSGGRG